MEFLKATIIKNYLAHSGCHVWLQLTVQNLIFPNCLQVFEKIKQEGKTDLFKKIIAVGGDVGEEHLGLSSVDRLTLVEHVQVVFHSAATLDFEADLKSTVNINLLGTRRVVEFCQEIRNLKVSKF